MRHVYAMGVMVSGVSFAYVVAIAAHFAACEMYGERWASPDCQRSSRDAELWLIAAFSVTTAIGVSIAVASGTSDSEFMPTFAMTYVTYVMLLAWFTTGLTMTANGPEFYAPGALMMGTSLATAAVLTTCICTRCPPSFLVGNDDDDDVVNVNVHVHAYDALAVSVSAASASTDDEPKMTTNVEKDVDVDDV